MVTENAPESMYRSDEGLGLWEHRGKVAAVGVGHSPTARRWDGRADSSVGALTILALRRAIEDAGVATAPSKDLGISPRSHGGTPVALGASRRPTAWGPTVSAKFAALTS